MRTLNLILLLVLSLIALDLSAGDIGGTDVRIGAADNRIGARFSVLDFDAGSGNYYAAVAWNDRWTFNISTDDGATFDRRYRLLSSQGIPALGLAVSGAWVYVGYTTGLTPQLARMRRFSVATGDLDLNYGGTGISNILVADTSPATVVDIAVESDIDSTDNLLYLSLIQSDGATRFFWDEPVDGPDFFEVAVGVSDAQDGLDMHWNPGFDTYSLFLSLVDQPGDIQIWRYDGTWSLATSIPYTGSQQRTAISAFGDRVVVGYLAPASNGQGVQIRQSSDGGTTWNSGTFIATPFPGQGDFFDVDITARGGLGLAVVYNLEAGASDRSLFQSKPDFEPGPWTQPRSFNDFDAVAGLPIALNWTPSDDYGVIYVGGTEAIPYFDLIVPTAIFLDGFESGNTSDWSVVIP